MNMCLFKNLKTEISVMTKLSCTEVFIIKHISTLVIVLKISDYHSKPIRYSTRRDDPRFHDYIFYHSHHHTTPRGETTGNRFE